MSIIFADNLLSTSLTLGPSLAINSKSIKSPLSTSGKTRITKFNRSHKASSNITTNKIIEAFAEERANVVLAVDREEISSPRWI